VFNKIMVPVDLGHLDRLEKALNVAAAEARQYGASVVYMGVAEEAPSDIARNPKEYEAKLAAFSSEQATKHGIEAEALPVVSTDPAAEISKLILKAASDCSADLVVMASHPPKMLDWILASHGGHVAEHADISVFVVR